MPLHLDVQQQNNDGTLPPIDTQLFRQRSKGTLEVLQARFNQIADVIDKLQRADWAFVENEVDSDCSTDYSLWGWPSTPYLSEESLRVHLQEIGVVVDDDVVNIVTADHHDAVAEAVVETAEDDDLDADDDHDDDLADDLDLNDDGDEDANLYVGRQLYLVRWQNLSAALVMARNERELLDILDEEADTTACSWWEYHGPLFLDFDLPIVKWQHVDEIKDPDAETDAPERWVPENIHVSLPADEDLCGIAARIEMGFAGSDTAWAAERAIFKLAFPCLHDALFEDADDPTPAVIVAAVQDEVARTMRKHRELRQDTVRRAAAGDFDAVMAGKLGTSIEQAQNMNSAGPPPELPPEQPLPPLVSPPEETGN
jgi:hypothetical protein